MDGEIEEIQHHLCSTPPECVQGFRLTATQLPVNWSDSFKTVWRLTCFCGVDTGSVLGYPLSRFNSDYHGPELFIGPLAFDCSGCGKVTEIIDTDLHGYHSELAKLEGGPGSCKIKGDGVRDRFRCLECREPRFSMIVAFVYWEAVYDLAMDEPSLAVENFFTVFVSCGICANCGKIAHVTDFGKL